MATPEEGDGCTSQWIYRSVSPSSLQPPRCWLRVLASWYSRIKLNCLGYMSTLIGSHPGRRRQLQRQKGYSRQIKKWDAALLIYL
ncbi:hypothetical protein Rin_00005080 [Candidatus Regiella insecticola 5.15]|uniref:Uncharacterized protein n=1 Tax=Candidatus Regiella insecticola 5.15 TaxID=1005043 RepID=G2GXL5_9ENTR|nr:hypothetical protein [Candidatus Regiella insecticola]EGY29519.1 hypothetical protein Rin_00005080 [Candidatus Regiella insecticola 5.15]